MEAGVDKVIDMAGKGKALMDAALSSQQTYVVDVAKAVVSGLASVCEKVPFGRQCVGLLKDIFFLYEVRFPTGTSTASSTLFKLCD